MRVFLGRQQEAPPAQMLDDRLRGFALAGAHPGELAEALDEAPFLIQRGDADQTVLDPPRMVHVPAAGG